MQHNAKVEKRVFICLNRTGVFAKKQPKQLAWSPTSFPLNTAIVSVNMLLSVVFGSVQTHRAPLSHPEKCIWFLNKLAALKSFKTQKRVFQMRLEDNQQQGNWIA